MRKVYIPRGPNGVISAPQYTPYALPKKSKKFQKRLLVLSNKRQQIPSPNPTTKAQTPKPRPKLKTPTKKRAVALLKAAKDASARKAKASGTEKKPARVSAPARVYEKMGEEGEKDAEREEG